MTHFVTHGIIVSANKQFHETKEHSLPVNHYTMQKLQCQAGNAKYVSATNQGDNVLDVVIQSFKPASHIKRISKKLYMKGKYDSEGNFITEGEVFEVSEKESPMRNRRSLRRIFKDLRQKIAHNFSGGLNELFVTLTYRGEEQNNDPEKIHHDFKLFWQKLKRAYAEAGLSYITIVEPHETGRFHIHLLLRANNVDHLFIPFTEMEQLWGHGNVNIERLEEVDNVGAYFVAYFSNLELDEEAARKYEAQGDVVEKNGKKFIKGRRLDFYPDGMQIARSSRDLEKPKKVTGDEAVSAIKSAGRVRMVNVKTIESVDPWGRTREAEVITAQMDLKDPF